MAATGWRAGAAAAAILWVAGAALPAGETAGAQLVFLGADPARGAPGPVAGLPGLTVLAMPALPEAAAARAEATAAVLRANAVSTFVAAPEALGGTVEDFFLVADAVLHRGAAGQADSVVLGGAELALADFSARLGAVVDALAPRNRQVAFLRLADPHDGFPVRAAEVQGAVGAAGFALTVVMVHRGSGPLCAETEGPAPHFALVAGVADRTPFGDGDGLTTAAEAEAFLSAALAREAGRGGDCAPSYSLIVKAADDPARILARHRSAPLFPEMDSALALESFEAQFLMRSEDPARLRGFLESCRYCPGEAALVERLRGMRARELALALETRIWGEIRADTAPDRFEIYLAHCTLCAFRAEAEARLAALRAEAEAAAAEARRRAEALERRDPALLRAWLADCAPCAGREEVAAALAAAEAAAARHADALGPCLARAGLPQQGGPRRLDQIDPAAAAAACGAVLAEFPGDPVALTAAGRIDQALGRIEAARAAYAAGWAAGVPAAAGLLAHLDFAPPDGGEADPARAEALAREGAARGDWLSREILIVLYSRGLIPGRTAEDAVALATDLAGEGNPVGQFFAGYFHLTGTGVPASDAAAAAWLERSVAQGYLHAYSFLAELLEEGRAGPSDPERAAALYWDALAGGDATARERLTVGLGARSREVIRLVQERLREAGIYAGRADGLPGPGTAAAVQRFAEQRARAG